jgi:hypothetical protein
LHLIAFYAELGQEGFVLPSIPFLNFTNAEIIQHDTQVGQELRVFREKLLLVVMRKFGQNSSSNFQNIFILATDLDVTIPEVPTIPPYLVSS